MDLSEFLPGLSIRADCMIPVYVQLHYMAIKHALQLQRICEYLNDMMLCWMGTVSVHTQQNVNGLRGKLLLKKRYQIVHEKEDCWFGHVMCMRAA